MCENWLRCIWGTKKGVPDYLEENKMHVHVCVCVCVCHNMHEKSENKLVFLWKFSPLPYWFGDQHKSPGSAADTLTHCTINLFISFFSPIRQNFSVCSLGCPETCSVAQADLKLTEIHLPLSPECWD